ncbi:DUF771 domain-containing protein [Sporolactobacillus shoreicorticis]|uniref:DUF771 domain-containing protein n=1 Tax=Sporolactobacillus shoreicorticis TaxID=1923877 RepID=A0ABW5SBP1_9BACL|nr:DUF771 domain-containing protein [Sporolactobacillus shoreicorticis]MCO7126187.1 DUF771 domain-containing protein [Sporolactobacillus shoreicorticis]
MPEKVWWTMKDLEEATGYKYDWLLQNILFRPEYRKMLDIEGSGKYACVYYPERKGDMWKFIASEMKEFLETYFADILRYDRRHKWQREKVASG